MEKFNIHKSKLAHLVDLHVYLNKYAEMCIIHGGVCK